MLTRIGCTRLFRPKQLLARYNSNVYPLKNVNAFPFGLSPSDAILQMAPYVSVLLMFKQFIGSLGARLLPGLGFESLQPTRILPVYFPAWVIDGELQASITYGEDQRNVRVQCINTYLPGNDFGILPLVSFWYQQLQHHQLVPFSVELENQFNTQSWPHGDVPVEPGFQFTPTSIKPNLIAAYPILIPLYLAQYDAVVPGIEREFNLTVFMEGFSKKGRIFAEDTGDQFGAQALELLPNAPKTFMRFTHLLDNVIVQSMRGTVRHFVRVAKMAVPQAPNMHSVLRKWLDDKLSSSPDLAPLLADLSRGSPTLRGEDERVRDFLDVADRSNVHMWLSLGSKLAATEMVIETIKSTTNVRIVGGPEEASTEEVMGSTIKALEGTVNDLTNQRQDTLPPWWREWEKRESGGEASANDETQTPSAEFDTQAQDGLR